MDYLVRVLAHSNSDLAWLLEHQLTGLRAALREAAAARPGDSAAADCQSLIDALDRLIEKSRESRSSLFNRAGVVAQTPALFPSEIESERTADEASLSGYQLNDTTSMVWTLIQANPRLAAMLPKERWRIGSEGWWAALHLAALALDPASAGTWNEQIAKLLGGEVPPRSQAISGPKDTVLVPAMPGKGGLGGLCILPDAPDDQRIVGLVDNWAGENWEHSALERLGRYVSLWLQLSSKAPGLMHCLEAVTKYGIMALEGDQRERYEDQLITRFRNLTGSAHLPLKDRVNAWVRIDEAFHAVLFHPLEDPQSQWAGWKREIRRVVFDWAETMRGQGNPVYLRTLPEDYAQSQQQGLTRPGDDIPLAGGQIGAVLVTLRLWSKVNKQVDPGRALYGNG